MRLPSAYPIAPLLALSLAAVIAAPAVSSSTPPAPPAGALVRLPVREITAFKDGHAFVLHEGSLPTGSAGDVVLDYLPAPVVGTFWPYTTEPEAKLTAVVASQRRLQVTHTALSLLELLRANVGASASFTEVSGAKYDGTILDLPTRSSQELAVTGPPNQGELLPVRGDVILLKTERGVKVVPLARIQDVTFRGAHTTRVEDEELRSQLDLKLDWGGRKAPPAARVGMVYLQRGFRWIPGYKITLDGAGKAAVKLQATLINELTDLNDAGVNLVIGVPTFAFENTPDPIGLEQAVAQFARQLQPSSPTSYAFSNAILSQTAGYAARSGETRGEGGGMPADLGPQIGDSGQSEDLFVYSVKHVTLRKGQRMVLPVGEFTLPYRDVYTLDVPLAPPPEVRANGGSPQQSEIMRLLSRPRVMHTLRLTNSAAVPLTTAPALMVRDNRVLAQGLMTYTSVGGEVDLPITPAVDVKVTRKEHETKRTPNAVAHNGTPLGRVDLAGSLCLTNYRTTVVELEVTRSLLGTIDSVDHDGAVEMLNPFDDAAGIQLPNWWSSYNWPFWWHQYNGIGHVKWKLKLEAGQSVELGYTWHYISP